MINKALSGEIVTFMQSYLNFYNELLMLENNKGEAIKNNDLSKLDDFVSREQAYILKSKGLEISKDKLLEKTDIQNCNTITFKQLMQYIDADYQNEINEIYNNLSQTLLEIKNINDKNNSLTELRLHRINNAMNQINNHPELLDEYKVNAKKEAHKGSSILSKKI